MAPSQQLHAIVRGRVQMVGFRYFVVERARALGLTGWVRNGEDDSTVEVVAEGEPDALRQLEEALRAGPPHARVEEVERELSDELDGYDSFEARI
jgi:acylphosphatase